MDLPPTCMVDFFIAIFPVFLCRHVIGDGDGEPFTEQLFRIRAQTRHDLFGEDTLAFLCQIVGQIADMELDQQIADIRFGDEFP